MSDVAVAVDAAPVEASGNQPAPAGNEAPASAEPGDVSDQGGEPKGPESAQPEPKPAERYKVKVAGQERELTLDELRQQATLAMGAQARFEEAARLRKEADAAREALLKDPAAYLRQQGWTQEQLYALAEKQVLQQIEEDKLSPEQKRIRELESKLKEQEDAKEAARKAEEEAAVAQQEQEYTQRLVGDLKAEFQKAGLALDDSLHLAGVVKFLQNASAAGEDVSVGEAVEFARYEAQERTGQFLNTLNGDQLLNYLGPQILDKIRKADIARIKNQPQEPSVDERPAVPRSGSAKETVSADDFFDSLGR